MANGFLRALYEIAESRNTTVGELTGTRRRYSVLRLPEPIAQRFGLAGEDASIRIDHFDEGISSSEIPFIAALWEIHDKERKQKGG